MSGLNMQIMDMIEEMQMRQFRMKERHEPEPETDKYGYPFEPMGMFSREPLGFLETAMRLQTEMVELFALGRKLNRHSPMFVKVSGQMERMISQLGSCCITKAVLEQQGENLDIIDGITIDWLRGMTAFNFRKCFAAFMDAREANSWRLGASDLSLRWSALDKRLLATAEKIEKIKAGKVSAELSADTDRKTSGSQAEDRNTESAETAAAFSGKAPACPIDKAAVREAVGERAGHSLPSAADEISAPTGADHALPVPDFETEPDVMLPDAIFDPEDDPEDLFGSEELFNEAFKTPPDWLIRRVMDGYVRSTPVFDRAVCSGSPP